VGPPRKKKQTSFRHRVAEFWGWFSSQADHFDQAIVENRCGDLTSEMTRVCDRLLPTLSWVFGPGKDGGHSFTVSGEGQIVHQLLAEYWLWHAPELKRWTFHGSRQPSDMTALRGMQFAVGDKHQVTIDGFILRTQVDTERQRLDITAWHPSFEHIPDQHHLQLTFLLLDETMGEFGTQNWVGGICVEPIEPGEQSTTLLQLPSFVDGVAKYYSWEKYSPLDAYSVYEIPEGFDEHRPVRRFGSTCIPGVIYDLIENDGTLPEDPLEGTGAEFVFVALDLAVFPSGNEVNFRGEIEDALGIALRNSAGGRTLGGAFGPDEAFIDVLLFDGDDSRETIRSVLAAKNLLEQSRLVNFA